MKKTIQREYAKLIAKSGVAVKKKMHETKLQILL